MGPSRPGQTIAKGLAAPDEHSSPAGLAGAWQIAVCVPAPFCCVPFLCATPWARCPGLLHSGRRMFAACAWPPWGRRQASHRHEPGWRLLCAGACVCLDGRCFPSLRPLGRSLKPGRCASRDGLRSEPARRKGVGERRLNQSASGRKGNATLKKGGGRWPPPVYCTHTTTRIRFAGAPLPRCQSGQGMAASDHSSGGGLSRNSWVLMEPPGSGRPASIVAKLNDRHSFRTYFDRDTPTPGK